MAESKKTECVKVWLSGAIELELRRLADRDERKLSDYIGLILRRHVYGHCDAARGEMADPERAD
jgi:cytidylate kinase